MNPKSLPDRQDKLVDRKRVGAFLGYVEDTTKQYLMWAPDMKKAIKVSANSVRFSEEERLKRDELGIRIQTTLNEVPTRNDVGRPSHRKPDVSRRILSHVEIPVRQDQQPAVNQEADRQGDSPSEDEPQPDTSGSSRKRPREDDSDNKEPEAKHLRAFLYHVCGLGSKFGGGRRARGVARADWRTPEMRARPPAPDWPYAEMPSPARIPLARRNPFASRGLEISTNVRQNHAKTRRAPRLPSTPVSQLALYTVSSYHSTTPLAYARQTPSLSHFRAASPPATIFSACLPSRHLPRARRSSSRRSAPSGGRRRSVQRPRRSPSKRRSG